MVVSVSNLRPTSEKDVLSMATVVASAIAAGTPCSRAAPHIVHCNPLPRLHCPVCITISVSKSSAGVSQDFADSMCRVPVEVVITDSASSI